MIKRPLIPVVICYCLGLIAPSYVTLPLGNIILFFSGALICCIAAFYKRKRVFSTGISFLVFFLSGVLFIYPYINLKHGINYYYPIFFIVGLLLSFVLRYYYGTKTINKDQYYQELDSNYN